MPAAALLLFGLLATSWGSSSGSSSVQSQKLAAKFHASPQQRVHLLQLRNIVASALNGSRHHGGNTNKGASGHGADNRPSVEEKAGKAARIDSNKWWNQRPFFIVSIVVGCLFLVALLLLCFFCTPLYPYCCRKCKTSDEEKDGASKTKFASIDDWWSTAGPGSSKDDGATGASPPYGVIRFATKYYPDSEELQVVLKGCSDLPANSAGSLDPYAVLRLCGKQQQQQKLKTDARAGEADQCATSDAVRDSTTPQFDFTGTFKVARADLSRLVVAFEIFDWSSAKGQHPMVARYVHDIDEAAAVRDAVEWCNFERKLARGHRMPDTGPGDVCLMLQQGLSGEPFKAKVIECKGVYLRDSDGKVDNRMLPSTYVDVTLTEPHGRIHSRRTNTVAKDRNPYFNEEFDFPVPIEKLRQCSLRVTLVHVSDIFRMKKPLGSVLLSDDQHEDAKLAREHWLAVSQPPGGVKAEQQQQRVSKCSWHYLVPPDEERRLWRARAMEAAASGVARRASGESQ